MQLLPADTTFSWNADEEMLDPVQKLKLIEEKVESLSSSGCNHSSEINELFLYGVALTRLVCGEDSFPFAIALLNLAVSYMSMGMYAQASSHLRRALTVAERVVGIEERTGTTGNDSSLVEQLLPQLYLRMGICLFHTKNFTKAKTMLSQALKSNEAIRGGNRISESYIFVALAKVYAASNEFAKADDFLQKAQDAKEAKPSTPGFDEEMAQIHIERGKICQQKISMVVSLVNQAKRCEGEADEDEYHTFISNHERYLRGQRMLAIEAYTQAHDLFMATKEADDQVFSSDMKLNCANLAYQIGNLQWQLGMYDAALHHIQDAADTYKERFGPEDQRTLYLLKDCVLISMHEEPRLEPKMFAAQVHLFQEPKISFKEIENKAKLLKFHDFSSVSATGAKGQAKAANNTDLFDDSSEGENSPSRHGIAGLESASNETLSRLKRLLHHERKAYGDQSLRVGQTSKLLADCYFKNGIYDRAAIVYKQALPIFEAHFGNSSKHSGKLEDLKERMNEALKKAKK